MRTVVVALTAALAFGVSSAGAASTVGVSIRKTGFAPKTATLAFGTKVVWTNRDRSRHQVVADDGSFASPILAPGKSYAFTFSRAGTFRYHDALHPLLGGSLTVKGPPPSLTLALDLPIATYGTRVTLSGKASNVRPGTAVAIYAQPWGQPSPVQLAIVQTGSDGSFGYATTTHLYTTYTASFQTSPSGPVVQSNPVIAQVQAKLRLLVGRKGWMRAQVTAGKSLWHRHVVLQRKSALGQWVSLRALRLDRYSGALFRPTSFLPRGRSQIRVALSVNQAGIGLLGATSATRTVRRR